MKKQPILSLIVAIIITVILIVCSSCIDTNTTAADADEKRFTVSDYQYTFYGQIFAITDTKTDKEYIIMKNDDDIVVLR